MQGLSTSGLPTPPDRWHDRLAPDKETVHEIPEGVGRLPREPGF